MFLGISFLPLLLGSLRNESKNRKNGGKEKKGGGLGDLDADSQSVVQYNPNPLLPFPFMELVEKSFFWGGEVNYEDKS